MIRAALIYLALCSAAVASQCDPTHIDLRGDWGQARFFVEVADDATERSQGLMHREKLASGAGMLFVYPAPQQVSFWMKNTLIPLDMIFIDANGRVSRVHPDAVPGDLTSIDGGEGVVAVLEINGGLIDRYGIAPGTEARHPSISSASAHWPCE